MNKYINVNVGLWLVLGVLFVSCQDPTSINEEDNTGDTPVAIQSGTNTGNTQVSNNIIIDDFDSGAGTFIGSGHNSKFEYHESTTIHGAAREIYLRDGWSGTYGGATYATVDTVMGTLKMYIVGKTAPEAVVMYGTAIGTFYKSWAVSPNVGKGSEMNLELTLEDSILIEVAASGSNSGITITLRSGNGAVNSAGFTLDVGSNLIALSEFTNLTETAASDIDGIAISGLNTFETFAIKNSEPVVTNNVYISNSSVQTWDPVYPSSADPSWTSTVCYQSNDFGITANWENPHNAFEVTQDNGQPHPWDNSTFDAAWINSYNDMDSQGPGGQNWSKYETDVAGNGEFVVQLIADNCSWVYLADENGDSPELIGYQATSTPGEYGVNLDGDHKLIFIIFDGGGLAGGKFRLETTESYGGTPPPIDPNTAPVADAGGDITKDATGQTTPVTLDGSASSDPDGDGLSYSWTLNGNEVATTETANVNLADGSYTLTLTVSDGELSDSDDVNVTVVNTIPEADAGSDQTKEATGPTTPITLTGSGSDADGDSPLTYSWSNGDSGTSTTVDLGVGVHTFMLTVTDPQGASDSDQVMVEITDTTAPELSFSQETGNLWPPNHKMVKVVTGIQATDLVDGSTDVNITVSSNEASNGRGDGNTDSDYEIETNSDGSMDVYVRAERSGKGSGRVYTIDLRSSDNAGNTATDSIEVSVAKSQGRR